METLAYYLPILASNNFTIPTLLRTMERLLSIIPNRVSATSFFTHPNRTDGQLLSAGGGIWIDENRGYNLLADIGLQG